MAESGVYSSQLKEVFDTFDTRGEGCLGKEALQELCKGLELEEYVDLLLEKVLGNNRKGKVKFDDFKEAFISILKDADTTVSDTRSSGIPYPVEVTPIYVLGNKTYGRRSKPNVFTDNELGTLTADDQELVDIQRSANERLAYKQGGRVVSPGSESEDNEFHIKRRRKDAPRSLGAEDETFEAQEPFSSECGGHAHEQEGQMNLTMTDPDVDSWREKLLEVWRSLGVGQDGYLTLAELRTVCNYIGVEMGDDDIWKLFKELDNDHDGRVSFEELANSFSQNSSNRPLTPSPRPSRSIHRTQRPVGTPVIRSLSAQRKLRLAATPVDRNLAPVALSSGEVTGLFSSLDVYHTGFAQPEDIIDLWEKHNIMNGADILTALGFDQNTKINLSELSFALEQTLANEDLDAVSHAALVTCQQELRHLQSSVDALTSERNKLRLDLQEANARAALLAKEVDERHAHMEKSNEVKLLTIEKKYQDQIRSLQGALELERETHSAHSAKLRQNLESEMEELKQQESKLKDHLTLAQSEVDRLQTECSKSGESLEKAYRINSRLQLEVDSLDYLRRKVAEYEQMADAGEEKQHYLNKIQLLEQANKDLKDKVDELTAELENLKQQLASAKRKLRGSSSSSQTKIPIREGANLSDYSRPRRKSSLASMSSLEADEPEITKTKRRAPKLTSRKGKTSQEEDSSSEHSLSNSQKLELLEKDQQQIEHSYRLEVANLEDKHQAEKESILQNFEKEKARLREEFLRSQQERLAEQQMELQNVFTQEKQDLLQKYESKKNLLTQQHTQEKAELLQRLKEEYEKDVDLRLGKLKEEFDKERTRLEESRSIDRVNIRDLEKMCTDLEMRMKSERLDAETQRENLHEKFEEEKEHLKKTHTREKEKIIERLEAEYRQKLQQEIAKYQTDHSRETSTLINSSVQDQSVISELEQKVSDLDLRLKLQREEIEVECDRQREELERKHELEMKDFETQHKLELLDIDNMLEQGVAGLQGKLRDDFETLVEEGKEKRIAAERSAMYEDLNRRISEMEAERGEILQQLEQKQLAFEEERRRVLEELDQKRQTLNAENEALEQKKVTFDEDSHKILDELERQETDLEQARDQVRMKMEDFEKTKQTAEARLEEQKKDLQEQLDNVRLQQEDLEAERMRLHEVIQLRESQLEEDRTHLEEAKFEFHVMKSQYEENLSKHELDLNSDLQQRIDSLEAEEQLLQERKAELVSEQVKAQEKIKVKEGELKAEEAHLLKQKEEFETERTQILSQLQLQKDQLNQENEQILLRQRDIEKEYSASLADLNKDRERLKDEHRELNQRQKDFEVEQASILKDLQAQKDEVKAAKEEGIKERMSLEELKTVHEAKERQLGESCEREKEKLCESYEAEKTLLMEKYQDEILNLQQQLEETRQQVEERKIQLDILKEEEQKQRELDIIQAVREDMQSEHVRQVTELQEAFHSEQTAMSEQARMLEEQVKDLHDELLSEQEKNRKEIEKKQKTVTLLQEQLQEAEDMRDSLKDRLSKSEQETVSTRERLERRIDELLLEKDTALTAVRAEVVQAVQQTQDTEKEKAQEELRNVANKLTAVQDQLTGVINERNDLLEYKGKVQEELRVVTSKMVTAQDRLTGIEKEKEELLEDKAKAQDELRLVTSKIADLQDQLSRVKNEQDGLLEYKLKYDRCLEDKISCEAENRDLRNSMSDLETEVKKLQNMKRLYDQSLADRERLEQQLQESLQAAGEISRRHDTSLDESTHSLLLKERDVLQTQVTELTEKLRDSRTAATELEKLKVELSNMTREKSELQDKVKTFTDTRTSKRREDKEQANAEQDEKKQVERKLQKVSDKLLKASTDLSVAQSQHLQEISRWKDCTKNMVDLEQFTNLQLGLIEQQRHMNELQAALQEKLELIEGLKEGHKKLVKQLESDKKELQTMLEHRHNLVKEKTQELIKTHEKLSERNLLVKSLYEENCQMARKVKVTEDRQRHAEKRCLHVERKCASLQKVINQACQNIENNLP